MKADVKKLHLKAAPENSNPAASKKLKLDPELLVKIHDNMIKARVLEERLIRMYKQNQGYFWIGGGDSLLLAQYFQSP